MKIIVFSDSHGNIGPMLAAVSHYKPDMILHLGDHIWDADCFKKMSIPMRRVRGNCDFGSVDIENDTVVINGIRIIMTHGHRYTVKAGLGPLMNLGRSAKADILLFGHTHIPLREEREGIVLMNPGTAGVGRQITCGLLRLGEDGIDGEIVAI